MIAPRLNFGRNITLAPGDFYMPRSEAEVLDILDRHRGSRIRCIGRLHSWSQIIANTDVLLDLRYLNDVRPVDGSRPSVQAGAGCQIRKLLSVLQAQKGWTLPSVGFITEQTVAGAISTGTHGSGRHSLSHYVESVRVARYDSDTDKVVVNEITDGPELRAARCSLGCLGIILSVQMSCRQTYMVEEHFREYSNPEDVIRSESEYPLQQFYLLPWRWTLTAQHRRESPKRSSRLLKLYHWYRFLMFDVLMHLTILFAVRIAKSARVVRAMFRWLIPASVISNWRVVGPSDGQLVMEHELFRHVELELFVRRGQLQASLEFLQHCLTVAGSTTNPTNDVFRSQLVNPEFEERLSRLAGSYCHHYPICVRRILTDDTLISMASPSGQHDGHEDWYSISLINYESAAERTPFEELAALLAYSMSQLFGARLHWGKLCPLPIETIRRHYPGFGEFSAICQLVDPDGRFRNDWTNALINHPQTKKPGS